MPFEHIGKIITKDPELDIRYKYNIHIDMAKEKVKMEFFGCDGVDSRWMKGNPVVTDVDVFAFLKGLFDYKKKNLIDEHNISKDNLDRLKSVIIAREI